MTFWRLLVSGGFFSMSRLRLEFFASSCCLRSSRAAFQMCCFCCICCSSSGCSMLAAPALMPIHRLIIITAHVPYGVTVFTRTERRWM